MIQFNVRNLIPRIFMNPIIRKVNWQAYDCFGESNLYYLHQERTMWAFLGNEAV